MSTSEYDLVRFTVDLVVKKDAISERRIRTIAGEMNEWLTVLGVESDDQANTMVETQAVGHIHDTSEGDRCPNCMGEVKDYMSGDTVAEV